MNRTALLVGLLLTWTLATSAWGAEASTTKKPNFIVINIDDLGYADIGPYGGKDKTPHLDRMAKEGRKLTSHYGAPVCSPSRAALMTGCYPKRSLPIPHVLFPAAVVGMHPDEITIAEVLKPAGYATACIGKWHLGDQAEFLPTKQGFDMYFGLPYSNDMGPPVDGATTNPDQPPPKPGKRKERTNKQEDVGISGYDQPPIPLLEGDKVIARVRQEEQFELTQQYTDRAVKFIKQHKDEPFFLYLPHTAVHFPHYPGDGYYGKSGRKLINDWVMEVDHSVGQILDTLRELNLDENTLVIFTSDNGGSLPHGSKNTPLRGSKGQTLEGGIRACTIAWWPGKIPAGTSSSSITSMMDVLPTLANLGGGKVPTDRKIDGVDIWPVLAGEFDSSVTQKGKAKPPRDHFFYFRGMNLEAVRSGPWKLQLARPTKNPDGSQGTSAVQLFNLEKDISESTNLAEKHPEIVKRLQELAQTMAKDLQFKGNGPGCRPLGKVKNPQPFIAKDGTVRADAVGTKKEFK